MPHTFVNGLDESKTGQEGFFCICDGYMHTRAISCKKCIGATMALKFDASMVGTGDSVAYVAPRQFPPIALLTGRGYAEAMR
jgi:hypothetical protein